MSGVPNWTWPCLPSVSAHYSRYNEVTPFSAGEKVGSQARWELNLQTVWLAKRGSLNQVNTFWEVCYESPKNTQRKSRNTNAKEEDCSLKYRSGPTVIELDKALKRHRMDVQSFHGRSFAGNHCNKCLKDSVISDICSTSCQNITKTGRWSRNSPGGSYYTTNIWWVEQTF